VTPERLLELIQAGESLDVEFKGERTHSVSDNELVEAVVCLANRSSDRPGWLLLGIEDDGCITGARPRHHDRTDPLRVQALIANRTRPALSVRVEVISVEGKDVIAIEVPALKAPVGTTDGKYLRRAIGGDGKPACLPMYFHDTLALQADRGLLDYSALVVPGRTILTRSSSNAFADSSGKVTVGAMPRCWICRTSNYPRRSGLCRRTTRSRRSAC
jgi:ATP-dependent DNA helicase RecG